MRKLTQKQRRFLAIHAARLMRRRLIWKAWKHERNRTKSIGQEISLYRDGNRHRARALKRWLMPEVFCLSKNTEETLRVLENMRGRVLEVATSSAERKKSKALKAQPIAGFYDFSTIREISPTAALILAAIFHRAKFITGNKLHTVNENEWDSQVRETLLSVGFHELLDMAKPRKRYATSGGIIIQPFTSGSNAAGEPVGKLQDALANLLPSALGEKLLDAEPYGGMFEAILNSHQWAYPEGTAWDFKPLRNWWLTGAVDMAAGRVTVVVFDQGISIPVSLPNWDHWEKLERKLQRFLARLGLETSVGDPSNDGLAIRMAMTIAKTQTNLPQHGKGLHTMVEVAQRARHGKLRIVSRRGEYIWETGRKPKYSTYRNSIGGTLVEWTLDL